MRLEQRFCGAPGQAMVEFALVGPFFLLLLFLIVEGALYVNAVTSIDNAAREGGRVAAICGAGNAPTIVAGKSYSDCGTAVNGAVLDHLGILPINALGNCGTNPCVDYVPNSPPGTTTTVTVTYRYQYYLNLFIGTGPTADISSSATVVSQQ